MTDVEVMGEGLLFPEGPIALPDGSVILVEIAGGRLTKVNPDGSKEVVAETGGGPNGAAFGPDGRIYVCNNGGFDTVVRDGKVRIAETLDSYIGGSIQAVDVTSGKVETSKDRTGWGCRRMRTSSTWPRRTPVGFAAGG
jgi:gluconolactonase